MLGLAFLIFTILEFSSYIYISVRMLCEVLTSKRKKKCKNKYFFISLSLSISLLYNHCDGFFISLCSSKKVVLLCKDFAFISVRSNMYHNLLFNSKTSLSQRNRTSLPMHTHSPIQTIGVINVYIRKSCKVNT